MSPDETTVLWRANMKPEKERKKIKPVALLIIIFGTPRQHGSAFAAFD